MNSSSLKRRSAGSGSVLAMAKFGRSQTHPLQFCVWLYSFCTEESQCLPWLRKKRYFWSLLVTLRYAVMRTKAAHFWGSKQFPVWWKIIYAAPTNHSLGNNLPLQQDFEYCCLCWFMHNLIQRLIWRALTGLWGSSNLQICKLVTGLLAPAASCPVTKFHW